MPRADFAFHHPFRVRWSETDAQGVVFNARYLDYADIAITEYYRQVGLRDEYIDGSIEFHVRKAEVIFELPIMPDEMIEVMARTTRIGNSSMTQQVEIHGVRDTDGDGGADDLRASVELVYVHVDLETHRPLELPENLKEKFTAFDARAKEKQS